MEELVDRLVELTEDPMVLYSLVGVFCVIVLIVLVSFSRGKKGTPPKTGKNQRKKKQILLEGEESYESDYGPSSGDSKPFLDFSEMVEASSQKEGKKEGIRTRRRKKKQEFFEEEEKSEEKNQVAEACYLPSEEMRDLLSKKDFLPLLDLSGHAVGVETLSLIESSLGSSLSVISFRLNQCRLSPETVKKLASFLGTHPGCFSHLDLSNNPLTWGTVCFLGRSITVSGLKELNLSKNRLGSAYLKDKQKVKESAEKFFLNLSSSPCSLTNLNLANNGIGAEAVRLICQGASSFSSLTYLNLSRNNIQNDGASYLMKDLSKFPSLISVDLSRNSISARGAQEIAEALKKGPQLESLDLRYNRLGERGIIAIAEALKFSKIRSLNLRAVSLTQKGLLAFAKILADNSCPSLRFLNLSHTSLTAKNLSKGNDISPSFTSALGANETLETLSLSDNPLGEMVEELGQALSKNRNLSTLLLANTGLNVNAVRSLCGSFLSNPQISNLDFSGNIINTDCLRKVSRMLKQRAEQLAPLPPLFFSIHNTNARDTGLKQIIQAGISFLPICNLSAMQLTGESLSLLQEALCSQKSPVIELNLSHNQLELAAWGHVVNILRMPNLTHLVLEHSNLSDDALKIICKGLKESRNLESLQILNNPFTEKGLKCLVEACKETKSLVAVVVDEKHRKTASYRELCSSLVSNKSRK